MYISYKKLLLFIFSFWVFVVEAQTPYQLNYVSPKAFVEVTENVNGTYVDFLDPFIRVPPIDPRYPGYRRGYSPYNLEIKGRDFVKIKAPNSTTTYTTLKPATQGNPDLNPANSTMSVIIKTDNTMTPPLSTGNANVTVDSRGQYMDINTSTTYNVDKSKEIGFTKGEHIIAENGTFNYEIDLDVPEGIKGQKPLLKIKYNSNGGYGMFGWGWDLLGLSSIYRVSTNFNLDGNTNGINLNTNDRLSIDGNRLQAISGNYWAAGSKYGLETETFSDIVLTNDGNGNAFSFTVTGSQGDVATYGTGDGVVNPMNSSIPYKWNLVESKDVFGNTITYSYINANGSSRISKIAYSKNGSTAAPYEINFVYSEAIDKQFYLFNNASNLVYAQHNYVVSEIYITYHSNVVKRYNFEYEFDGGVSRLNAIRECNGNNTCFNPTKIRWENNGHSVTKTNLFAPPATTGFREFASTRKPVLTGDFNGDLKKDYIQFTDESDLLQAFINVDNTNFREVSHGISLYSNRDLDKSSHFDCGQNCNLNKQRYIQDYLNFFVFDIDNDGSDELLRLPYRWSEAKQVDADVFADPFNAIEKEFEAFLEVYKFNGTSFVKQSTKIPLSEQAKFVCSIGGEDANSPRFIKGDFDGNGILDFVIHNPMDGHQIGYFKNGQSASITNDIARVSGVARVVYLPVDMNGDGKTELLVASADESFRSFSPVSVATINNDGTVSSNTSVASISEFASPRIRYMPQMADFNGDGKTDMLVLYEQYPGNYMYKILFSNGVTFVDVPNWGNPFNPSRIGTTITNQGDADNFMMRNFIEIVDLNKDGKADIVQIEHENDPSNCSQGNLSAPYDNVRGTKKAYYLLNISGNFVKVHEQDITLDISTPMNDPWNYCTSSPTAGQQYLKIGKYSRSSGDQNNDLISDILIMGGRVESNPRLISFQFGATNRVKQVTDGMGRSTEIIYDVLKKGQSWYTGGTTANSASIVKMDGPMHVVRNVMIPDGVGGTNIIDYSYEEGLLNPQGLGFLGFLKLTAYNRTTKHKKTNNYRQYFDLRLKIESIITSFIDNGTERSIRTEGFTYNNINYLSPKRTYSYVSEKNTVDFLTGTRKLDSYSCEKGLVTNINSYTWSKGPNGTEVQKSSEAISYTYQDYNAIRKLIGVSSSSTIESSAPVNKQVTFVYSSDGKYLNTMYEGSATTFKNKTQYSYTGNTFGLVTAKTVTSSDNTQNRTESYEYSSDGLFLEKKVDFVGDETRFRYDALGLLTSKVDFGNLSTFYQYDGMGRLIKSNLPDGTVSEISYAWVQNNTPANAIYFVTLKTQGAPDVITYYDTFGREVKKTTSHMNGATTDENVHIDYVYNNKGLKWKESMPYTGTSGIYKEFFYDDYLRPINSTERYTGTMVNASVNYKPSSTANNNNYTEETTIPMNGTRADYNKKYDYLPTGALKSKTDEFGTITYSYNGFGNVTAITQGTRSLATFTYDNYGRTLTKYDPYRGTFTYSYNSFDEITQIILQNGSAITNTITRDSKGDITSSMYNTNVWGLNYTYSTEQNGSKGNITEIQTVEIGKSNLPKVQFKYNALGKIVEKTEVINGKTFTMQFAYDNLGRKSSLTYSTGLVLNYNYHPKTGQLISISSNKNNNASIWELVSENERGQITSSNYGTKIKNVYVYDQNYKLSSLTASNYNGTTKISDIYKLTLSINPINNNVTSKNNEEYVYDNNDRLVEVYDKTTTPRKLRYKYSYTSNGRGNIESEEIYNTPGDATTKTTLLNTYETSPMDDRVASVAQPSGGPIPLSAQNITYNCFNKVNKIQEVGYVSNFTYGYDEERKLMEEIESTDGTDKFRYTHYFDGYELVTDQSGNTVIERTYIYTPEGLTAIVINDNRSGSATNGEAVYYVHKDHLGSIEKLSDINGNIKESYSYDPWGRRRNPSNLSYSGVSLSGLLTRGYTGHEHLDKCGLINMNARLYDVYQKRFISPDALALATPEYSTYAYALNNPMTFLDEDGNCPICVPIIIIVAVALAGSYAGGSIANKTGDISVWNWKSWETWKGIGIGMNVAVLSYASGGIAGGFAGSASGSAVAGMVVGGYVGGAVSGALMTGYATNWDGASVARGAVFGGAFGALGAVLGNAASGAIGSVIKGAAGTYIGEMAGGALAGGVGGFLQGYVEGGGNLNAAWQGAAYGASSGVVFGLIGGAVKRSQQAQALAYSAAFQRRYRFMVERVNKLADDLYERKFGQITAGGGGMASSCHNCNVVPRNNWYLGLNGDYSEGFQFGLGLKRLGDFELRWNVRSGQTIEISNKYIGMQAPTDRIYSISASWLAGGGFEYRKSGQMNYQTLNGGFGGFFNAEFSFQNWTFQSGFVGIDINPSFAAFFRYSGSFRLGATFP